MSIHRAVVVTSGHSVRRTVAVHAHLTGRTSAVALLKGGVMDLVFEGNANDMAVPTVGVGTVPGDPGFPVPGDRSFR